MQQANIMVRFPNGDIAGFENLKILVVLPKLIQILFHIFVVLLYSTFIILLNKNFTEIKNKVNFEVI